MSNEAYYNQGADMLNMLHDLETEQLEETFKTTLTMPDNKSLQQPIEHLERHIECMVERRRWRYNEMRKEFPYKCWPHTKTAAKKYKADWIKGIAELNEIIKSFRTALKILKNVK